MVQSRPVTLITGASAGLGAEFARACARRGEALVLVARRRAQLEKVAAEVGGAEIVEADLSEDGAPSRLVQRIEAAGMRVDTLINNAGFGLVGRFADLSRARQLQMIDLNIRCLTELCHLVLPAMIERGRGAILNVASTAAFQPGPGFGVYFATKAYVLAFSEALHEEMKGRNVRVSCLCPGPTRTEFGEVAGFTSSRFDRFSGPAEPVVALGLSGLDRNQAVIIPGFLNKGTALAARFVPRALMRRIVASIKG